MLNPLKQNTADSSSSTKNKPFFSPATIQPKLTIGQPNDKYEQEADAMADQVMRMPQNGPAIQKQCSDCDEKEKAQPKRKSNFLSLKPLLQSMRKSLSSWSANPLMRKSESGGGEASPELTTQLNSSKGSGSPLPDSTNQFMSNAFGNDFSNVRVHTGSKAIQMNQDLNARAFAHGSDVYFNKGEYSPESSSGKSLLAHELTHVVQQSGGLQKKIQKTPTPDPCTYGPSNRTNREIHLNLGLRAVRIYEGTTSSPTVAAQFNNIITGPNTVSLARRNGWCHMYPIIGHQRRSSHGLLNFVNYCEGYGFHSNFWKKGGKITRIPGSQSAGCARLEDADASSTTSGPSDQLYRMVSAGDCVRIYSRSHWRNPTFANCSGGATC